MLVGHLPETYNFAPDPAPIVRLVELSYLQLDKSMPTLVVHCHAVVVLVMVPEVMSACKLVLDHRVLVAAYR